MRVHTNLILTGIILLAGSISNLAAQSNKSCGHDHAQGHLFDSPADFEKAKSEVIKGAYPKYLEKSGQKNNSTISVPVVFHIIHSGEAEGVGSNIPAGRVQAQLDVLNQDFSATNSNFSDATRPEWDAAKGNPMISFCLATVDPSGAATTGIVRHDIAITGTDANDHNIEAIKETIFWDSHKYMNVYVVSIPGTDASGGVVGYAFLPYFGPVGTSTDGIVVDYNWFGGAGYSQSGDKTLTHEVGHYLGLFHTFNGYSCDDDDGAGDTPNMDNYTAAASPTLTCGNPMNPYPTGPSSCGNEQMYINYMDYVNDEDCPTSFTNDQVAVMRGVLNGTAPGFTTRLPLVTHAATACSGAPVCDLAASTTHTNPNCADTNDGTATVTATAGTSPYTYAWSTSPSQTTNTATGLSAGTYFVTTTDAGGCTVVNSAVIEAPSGLVTNVSATDETSQGAGDGTITAAPSGGTPGYTYQWNNGLGTLSTHSGLSPGTYAVTVTDSAGCTSVGSGTIDEGPCSQLTVGSSTTNVLCFNGTNGQATITVSGGVGPYTYSWNGVAFGNERFNLAAGSYTVVVTDSEGCTGSTTFTITEPSDLTSSVSTTGLTGTGQNDGTATASVVGGTSPYQYAWSNGGGNNAMIGNLAPAAYTVTVTDGNNCTTTSSADVADYNCSTFDITLSGGELLCAGDNGLLSVSNIASNGPYVYNWNTGGTSDAITINAGGTYTVSIQDGNGCISSQSKVIAAAPSELAISHTSFAESSPDANNGRIETQVSGGTPSYTYLWSNGATSDNVNNLPPGSYSFTVTDFNNCSAVGSATISEFTCTSFPVGLSSSDITCHGGSDGFLEANPSSIAPYSYEWSNGATSKSIDNLVAGTYAVTVSDSNACTTIVTATINQPSEINITINQTNESSEGGNNGGITTTVTGGTPGYTYVWADGSTDANRSGLAPGTYNLTVRDSVQCNNSITVTIQEYNCSPIVIAPVINHIGCSGDASGGIVLHVQEILAPYTVNWSTGSTDEQVSELTAGNYSVTLTDAGGCELLRTFTLVESPPLVVDATATDETANDRDNGTATVIADGGTAPYIYEWSNGSTTVDVVDLAPGAYVVTVLDSNGCTSIDSVNVTAFICPPFDLVGINMTNNNCAGDANGVLGASISGGVAPYEFNWSNGSTTAFIDGLIADIYSLIVTDGNNCQVSGTATLVDPLALLVNPTINHVSAVGLSDGDASLGIQGGTAPYSILWSTGATLSSIDNLAEGNYAYTVTDDLGCQEIGSITIDQYVCPVLNLDLVISDITCQGEMDGGIRAIPGNGTAPYTFVWSIVSIEDSISGLSAGTYGVTTTDAKGCSVIGETSIMEPQSLSSSMEVLQVTGHNSNDGSIAITITGGTAPYEVVWTDGGEGATRTDLAPGEYAFMILDRNRCSTTGTASIDEFDCPVMDMSTAVFNNECEDGDVGGIEAVVSGGLAPFTYLVNDVPYDSASIRGLPAGSYELIVTDVNGCPASATFEVETPMMMTIDDVSIEHTSGNLPGSATVSVIGGSEPYSYLWSDGRTGRTNNALFPGIHQVNITDSIGCVIVYNVAIQQLDDVNAIQDLQLFETHPNPASEMVSIQLEFSEMKDVRVVITNATGQPVYDELLSTDLYDRDVDISGFAKGLYSINVYTADEVVTKPLAIF